MKRYINRIIHLLVVLSLVYPAGHVNGFTQTGARSIPAQRFNQQAIVGSYVAEPFRPTKFASKNLFQILTRQIVLFRNTRTRLPPWFIRLLMASWAPHEEGGVPIQTPETRPIVVVADKVDTQALGVPVQDVSKSADKIAELIRINPDILIVRSATKVTAEVLKQLPNLKVIIRGGHGTDNIDTKYAEEHGIQVLKTGGSEKPVSALIMRMVARAAQGVATFRHDDAPESFFALSEWQVAMKSKIKPDMPVAEQEELAQKADALFQPIGAPTIESLYGKTIGIIGFGGIGQQVAANAKAMGMNVVVYSPSLVQNPEKATRLGYRVGALNEIYSESHFVVPIMGLNKEGPNKNLQMVNAEVIGLIKRNPRFVALINADRAELVDEVVINQFLAENPRAQYIVDEIPKNVGLRSKVLYTPHIGASTPSGEKDVVRATAATLRPIYEKLKAEVSLKIWERIRTQAPTAVLNALAPLRPIHIAAFGALRKEAYPWTGVKATTAMLGPQDAIEVGTWENALIRKLAGISQILPTEVQMRSKYDTFHQEYILEVAHYDRLVVQIRYALLHNGNTLSVSWNYTHPELRRQGIATSVLAYLIAKNDARTLVYPMVNKKAVQILHGLLQKELAADLDGDGDTAIAVIDPSKAGDYLFAYGSSETLRNPRLKGSA